MPTIEELTTQDRDLIVVGVDGTSASETAIRWALDYSPFFGPVQPVAAWSLPWWASTPSIMGGQPVTTSEDFVAEVEEAATRALHLADHTKLRAARITQGPAGPTLVEAAAGTSLLVVGTRGRGAIAESVLGSVSSYCAANSPVPVAIIPNSISDNTRPNTAIVAIDGSNASIRALQWAMDNLPPEVAIEAVHVWDSAANTSLEFTALPVDLIRANATRTLNRSIANARDQAANSQRVVRPCPEQGDARTVLRSLSQDIEFLILGARGRSGIAHLLLGSVTTALVHQPDAPTIVVPCLDREHISEEQLAAG